MRADLRGVGAEPIENLDAQIEEAVQPIAEGETRRPAAERLRAALFDPSRSDVPRFPPAWRLAPNVMFDRGDPVPQHLDWGDRRWATADAYDKDLALFLGRLACSEDATPHVAQGLARRALFTAGNEPSRVFPKLLAARLLGGDCPHTAGLPDELRAELRRLADR